MIFLDLSFVSLENHRYGAYSMLEKVYFRDFNASGLGISNNNCWMKFAHSAGELGGVLFGIPDDLITRHQNRVFRLPSDFSDGRY